MTKNNKTKLSVKVVWQIGRTSIRQSTNRKRRTNGRMILSATGSIELNQLVHLNVTHRCIDTQNIFFYSLFSFSLPLVVAIFFFFVFTSSQLYTQQYFGFISRFFRFFLGM